MKKFYSETAFLFILCLSVTVVFSSFGPRKIAIVKVGDTKQLECSPGLSPDSCPEWEYQPPKASPHGNGDRRVCFCNSNVQENESRINCKLSGDRASLLLTIQNATANDAGTYLCMNDGANDATPLHSTMLIVTDDNPRCSSNVTLSEVVGPNECSRRMSADSVRLSCSAAFHGADDDEASAWPLLQWRIEGQENSLNSTCFRNSSTVTCTLDLDASTQLMGLMGKTLICSNRDEHNHSCRMGPVRVLYAFNHSAPTLSAAYPGWTVVCEANTNSDSCSYKWKELKTQSDGYEHTKTVSNGSTMALSTPGRFRCEARCSLQGHTCLIFPIAINVQEAVPVTDAAIVGKFTRTTGVSTKPSYLAVCLSAILLISDRL